MLLDESNNVVGDFSYMPYGGLVDNLVSGNTSYRFTGQEYDTETLLHNFRARLYDSETAIFYGSDPAGQGYAPFAYAGNNPIIRIDKDGKFWQFIIAPVVGAVINIATNWDKIKENPSQAWSFGFVGAATGLISVIPGGSWVAPLMANEFNLLANGILRNEEISPLQMLSTAALTVTAYGLSNIAKGNGFFDDMYAESSLNKMPSDVTDETMQGLRGSDIGNDVSIINENKISIPKNNPVNSVNILEGSALKIDEFHNFTRIIENYANDASMFPLKGGDGILRQLYQIEGTLNGKTGIFEWIIEGQIMTHRRFIENGILNGIPNQIIK